MCAAVSKDPFGERVGKLVLRMKGGRMYLQLDGPIAPVEWVMALELAKKKVLENAQAGGIAGLDVKRIG